MLTVGRIVAAHGIKGEVKVVSLSENPRRFRKGSALHLEDAATLTVESTRTVRGNELIVKFAEVPDRTAAEALRGKTLTVPKEDAAKLPPDRFYRFDLLGLSVRDTDGKPLGTLEDVIESGANDVFCVRTESGKTVLLPALKQVVADVDLAAGTMTVSLLPGLWEACSYDEG